MSGTSPGARVERAEPDRVTLAVRSGAPVRDLPPVEIYLGTEPAQSRATRAFVWSIERVRDPGRVYHVHVMSDLGGFDRRAWTTGFTNYRFAIPHFAGGRGRAIYCDEDQIFLTDPGVLFDLPGLDRDSRCGFLAISDTETSVMLIDCERMAAHWTLPSAQYEKKKAILRRTRREPGIRGALHPDWNARDEEYRAGRSHLLHYSTLHTQPWRPFPERFAYRANRDEQLWLDLEREAIAKGFEPFSAESPTSLFRGLLTRERARHAEAGPAVATSAEEPPEVVREAVAALLQASAAGSLLELTPDWSSRAPLRDSRWGVSSESVGLLPFLAGAGAARDEPPTRHDGVLSLAGLGALPPEDMPWVVEELFRRARHFVVAAVPRPARIPKPPRGHPPTGTPHTCDWWVGLFEAAASRHPGVCWQLALTVDGDPSREGVFFRQGGRAPGGEDPSVWVLTDDRPGNATQSLGLAEELGWRYRQIELDFRSSIYIPNPILGAVAHVLSNRARRQLEPPWPDLVIAAGRRTAPVTRFIAAQSQGRSRTVQLGRKGANPAQVFDLAISPAHAGLYPHPNRIETGGTLTRVSRAKLSEAAAQWDYLFGAHPSPRIAVLVGGRSHGYAFTPEVASRLGRDVALLAARVGGTVVVTTSRRTGEPAADALAAALPDAVHFHRWDAEQKSSENPLLGYLALADVLVVTGESESMLAEAIASGKPVYIYPLPRRRVSLLMRIGLALVDWIVQRAEDAPRNDRGTTRPQQGLELLCSRLVEKGYVRPNRNLAAIHQSIVERGLARMFDGELGPSDAPRQREIEAVADRVRALMGARDG